MKIAYVLFALSITLFVLVVLYGFLQKKVKPNKDIQQRMDFVERKVTSLTPREILAAVQHRVILAGWARKHTGGQVLATSAISFAIMIFVMIFLLKGKDYPMLQYAMFVFVGGCLGGYMPFAVMASTLKNQADNIRERRRQYVKAEALKAPVKILFPLVLFIFPAIFVVVLVPTLLTLMKNL